MTGQLFKKRERGASPTSEGGSEKTSPWKASPRVFLDFPRFAAATVVSAVWRAHFPQTSSGVSLARAGSHLQPSTNAQGMPPNRPGFRTTGNMVFGPWPNSFTDSGLSSSSANTARRYYGPWSRYSAGVNQEWKIRIPSNQTTPRLAACAH